MKTIENISTIGFEGEHRSGKGTQIEKLKDELEEQGVAVLVVKGDGRRPTEDNYPVKLDEEIWKELDANIAGTDSEKLDWDKAAYRLARELVIVRDRVLPQMMKEGNYEAGVLIVDRTVLSRGVVAEGDSEEMYTDEMRAFNSEGKPKGKEIDVDEVIPDVIFNIKVPTEDLIGRIEEDDLKREQRLKHIHENEGKYDAEFIQKFLPEEYMDRIVEIDGTQSEEEIHSQIVNRLKENKI